MLLLDCGNTALKCQHNHKINTFYLDDNNFQILLKSYINSVHPDMTVVFSSVASHKTLSTIKAILDKHFNNPIKIATTESSFGSLKIGYNNTKQLGVDRWLTMIATQHITSNRIIIDAGSWIKMDVILTEGQHLGGVIISKSRQDEETLFKRFKLKEEHCNQQPLLFGTSTQQCLCISLKQYGLNSVKNLLTKWIASLGQPCHIIIGGGDAQTIKNEIRQLNEHTQKYILDIQQNENLVLSGLSIRYAL